MRTFLFLALLVFAAACKKTPPEPVGAYTPEPTEDAKPAPPSAVQKVAQNFARVSFAYDSATLDAASKAAISDNAAILTANPEVKIEVQGHADDRGTTDYNLALGDSRAEAVRSLLVAGGVAPSRVVAVSYGEERPRSQGATETAWAENRRAEFRITWSGEALVEGTTP